MASREPETLPPSPAASRRSPPLGSGSHWNRPYVHFPSGVPIRFSRERCGLGQWEQITGDQRIFWIDLRLGFGMDQVRIRLPQDEPEPGTRRTDQDPGPARRIRAPRETSGLRLPQDEPGTRRTDQGPRPARRIRPIRVPQDRSGPQEESGPMEWIRALRAAQGPSGRIRAPRNGSGPEDRIRSNHAPSRPPGIIWTHLLLRW